MTFPLLDLLCCPRDHSAPLVEESGALVCPSCSERFPILDDGLVSFLSAEELSEQDHIERQQRDEESSWYDAMFEGYTNVVEVTAGARRVGQPTGPILDAGCGNGRITEALLPLGQPIVAVDYSEACLRRMKARTKDAPVTVLGVQSDLRWLPLRDGSVVAATSIEVYPQMREADRSRFARELSRVIAPGGVLSVSCYNYNLMFKLWRAMGHEGARSGQHMLGGDYFYVRLRRDEFRRELEEVFDVEELTGVRNIPARSLAQGMRKVGLKGAGDRFLDWMVERGHKADFWLESVPAVAGQTGFLWQAKARRRR